MIVVNLDVVLATRKMRSKELSERIGITEQNVSLLKSGKVKGIRFDTLARICAVLAGDLHHYSRYTAKDVGTSFFTAGGGGAYFAPTHILKNSRKINWLGEKIELKLKSQIKKGKSTGRPACWPSRGTSRRLSFMTLAFPFRYYGFAVCLGFFYWMMTWLYATTRSKAASGNTRAWATSSSGTRRSRSATFSS